MLEVANHDKIRQALGLEYEYLLKEQLRNLEILFKSEVQSRSEGMLRTPDITLNYPILIRVNEYPLSTDSETHESLTIEPGKKSTGSKAKQSMAMSTGNARTRSNSTPT